MSEGKGFRWHDGCKLTFVPAIVCMLLFNYTGRDVALSYLASLFCAVSAVGFTAKKKTTLLDWVGMACWWLNAAVWAFVTK